MNGAGSGGPYVSEDDYEDYKPSPGHLLSSSAAYFNSSNSASLGTSAGAAAGSGGLASGGPGGGGGSSSYSSGAPTTGGGNQGSSASSRNQVCCLVDDGKRCNRFAGNASYSKRIQKTVYYKRLKLEADHLVRKGYQFTRRYLNTLCSRRLLIINIFLHSLQANHIYICDYHKMVIQNARTRQKKDSDDEMNDGDDVPEVDLFQLQVNTLRRYKKHFKISSRPGLNKAQLADVSLITK
jgi:histone deacetylase complex subunit SAP30